jgi:hypothetical protein
MQLTIDIGYDQVFQLVRQLSPKERERLFHENGFSITPSKQAVPEVFDEEYYDFLMKFPVVSEEEIEQIYEAKKEVDKCRPVSL